MRYESWNETFTASIASYHDGDTTKVLPIATPPGTEARAALFVIYFYLASLPRPNATSHTMVAQCIFQGVANRSCTARAHHDIIRIADQSTYY